MTKEEALEEFLEHEVKSASAKFVFASMSCLDKVHKRDSAKWFCDCLREVLREAPDLYFLQIALVRSRALMGRPFYRLEAYGADLYLSEPLLTKELEFTSLYRCYAKFAETVEEESRAYMFQIGKAELRRIKLAELHSCQRIVEHLFMETAECFIQSQEFQALSADKKVQFHVSEYRGEYKILLTKDRNFEKMGGWLCGILQADGAG